MGEATTRAITGAIAAGHALTVDAAALVLRAGGNAVDASIGGLLMACVCEPVLASLGGGGFMMIGEPDRDPALLDFFVETPATRPGGDLDIHDVLADFGTVTQGFAIGAGTCAVPGFVPGLLEAHRAHGRLPFADLVAPAKARAEAGVPVTPYQARLFEVVGPILLATPGSRALFAPGGRTLIAGETFQNPQMAEALALLLDAGGADTLALAMVDANAEGGALDARSAMGYVPQWRDPLHVTLGDAHIALNPPPSAGGTLIGAMIAGLSGDPTSRALADAMASTDRAWIEADRDIARFAGRDARPTRSAVRGTTHISVVDGDGMAVAATVSNGEGNGTIVPGLGFMVNNMLGEDDVNPRGRNWPPGQRLSSMMAPTLARQPDGSVLALGSGGSNRIRTALFQVLARHLAGGVKLEDAIAAPRLHVENGHLDFEDRLDAADRQSLLAGFADYRAWDEPGMFFGGVHAVARSAAGAGSRFSGAGDPRRDGVFRNL